MKKAILLLAAIWCCQHIAAQLRYSVGFEKQKAVSRHSKDEVVVPIQLRVSIDSSSSTADRRLLISVDHQRSTLPTDAYTIDNTEIAFPALSKAGTRAVYLRLKPDSIPDRQRKLVLQLSVRKGDEPEKLNMAKEQELEIEISEIKAAKPDSTLKGYRYLAYVGTNFDLVDRVRASELFFASNIFLPPSKKKGVGFYLNLYGNRTMITTDSTPEIRRETRLVALSDTNYRVFSSQMSLVRTVQSDNLGAFCSPLIRLGAASNASNNIQLYLMPMLEFIWRRSHVNHKYSNARNTDSITMKGSIKGSLDYSDVYKADFNEFVFNAGCGVMVVHETSDISLRVHGAVGYASTFTPFERSASTNKGNANPSLSSYGRYADIYFSGRAWITESTTGLTLQAEVTNTMIYSRPFYGVTLSKAISFTKLGNIFQPIAK